MFDGIATFSLEQRGPDQALHGGADRGGSSCGFAGDRTSSAMESFVSGHRARTTTDWAFSFGSWTMSRHSITAIQSPGLSFA